ncbi:hypothetical protein P280DRAFT_249427 [Massarina eburnea CBS 473.64]|uniref:Uncharacterized protein n=1 Tax=Massarina eburnea CBS 473.64 TaxID=1395130 RepID=A0A6A6S6V3_9PLEO|nr:hypothetical protein P280DRAFT_249427 [Massarina eburnea CBS 473.64]
MLEWSRDPARRDRNAGIYLAANDCVESLYDVMALCGSMQGGTTRRRGPFGDNQRRASSSLCDIFALSAVVIACITRQPPASLLAAAQHARHDLYNRVLALFNDIFGLVMPTIHLLIAGKLRRCLVFWMCFRLRKGR